MRKLYVTPEISIVQIESKDIISLSSTNKAVDGKKGIYNTTSFGQLK